MSKAYVIKSDWSQVKRELRRLQGIPSQKTKRKLDRVLDKILKATKARVHVQTGSLKGSGKKRSRMVMNTYRGHFLFGGTSPGIHNPVDYAVYEQEREDSHDFMRGIESFHPLWVAAIKDILRGK